MYYQKNNFNGIYDFRSHFHNTFMIESHLHEYSEVFYCQKGRCEIVVNGKKLELKDQEFVFIPPNYIHQYRCTDVVVVCAVFSNDFIPLYFKLTRGSQLVVDKFPAGELKSVFELLPTIDKCQVLLLTAYLNLICHKVLACGELKKASVTDGVLYQRVISYIADHFQEELSLGTIAQKFGYNPKYLSTTLHSLTGVHFSDLIAMYRIEHARELLMKNRELSVTEIAVNSGFPAMNTFNRQFKKITTMTPSEYRRLYSIAEM